MRRLLKSAVAAALCAALSIAAPASAQSGPPQSWPQRPVRVVLPFLAGTGPDLVARLLTEKLSQSLGQQFVVDNRGGANGIVAMEAVAKAPADGYTIVFADIGQFAINRSLYRKLPYDPVADFAPVSVAYTTPFYVLASGKGPYKSLSDLLAAARAKPGGVNYASSGSGSPTHLFMEQMKSAAGVDLAHIPFKGSPQIVPGVLSGEIAVVMLGMGSVRGLVEQGQLRALAVTGAARSSGFPDIPTVAEAAGLKDYASVTWVAFAAPAKTPKDIVERLSAEVRKVLALADVKSRMAALGFDPLGSTPEQMAQRMREDTTAFAAIIKATGAQAD